MNEIPHPGFDKPEQYETFNTTNGLEEAAEKYAYGSMPDEMKSYVKPVGDEVIKNFIAGAKWQKEQSLIESHKAWMDHKSSMINQIEKAKWQGYDKGLADGTVLGKEQMMKDAVEGVVVGDGEHCWIDANIPMSWMYQDKVCIVKED